MNGVSIIIIIIKRFFYSLRRLAVIFARAVFSRWLHFSYRLL